jgi:hypothetical protein
LTHEDEVAVEAAFEVVRKAGVAPGDIVQRVLELAHATGPVPCGDGAAGRRARVTTVIEETARSSKW